MRDIELILEEWIAAFNQYGHYIEVFANPSSKDLKDIGTKNVRWIADLKKKKVYMWNALGAMHGDAWVKIKKEIKDDRSLYRSGDLLTGVTEAGKSRTDSMKGVSPVNRKKLKDADWSFAERYIPDIKSVVEKIS